MFLNYLIVGFVSLLCIALELFFTRILNLKTWNHIVYIIIPFAILGYGIGANINLIFSRQLQRMPRQWILGGTLFLLGLAVIGSMYVLALLPLEFGDIIKAFTLNSWQGTMPFLQAYAVVMVPFVLIGFLIVYLFAASPRDSHKLYFLDMVGAGLGAFLFFPLINHLQLFPSMLLLSWLCLALSLFVFFHHKKLVLSCSLGLLVLVMLKLPALHFMIDGGKGWEWIPGYYDQSTYQTKVSRWSPLGRTEIYRMTDAEVRASIFEENQGTFLLNLDPVPEFSYAATNGLSGTPIYNYAPEGLARFDSKLALFSIGFEAPYLLLDHPSVLVIGAGGGRDIFMANTHGFKDLVGAEINPVLYQEMMPGGAMYDYSGRIYTVNGARIANIDGRNLVRQVAPGSKDLIILNGVDTFSGLSTGAYAYAESYLYTKNALLDYLRALKDTGMINFIRWDPEALRLQAIAMDALKTQGFKEPWKHIIMGSCRNWAVILVKKTPFTEEERAKILDYYAAHDVERLFPSAMYAASQEPAPGNEFDAYAAAFAVQKAEVFADLYPDDISVITDDSPFFYKHFKFDFSKPLKFLIVHHTGTIVFITQILILLEALFFICLFIFMPLWVFKRDELRQFKPKALSAFVIYFACLGAGYMFFEIPLMQKFTVLLGSPIYSISATLAVLLCATGLGSLSMPYLQSRFRRKTDYVTLVTFAVCGMTFALISPLGNALIDFLLPLTLAERILGVAVILFPFGFCLGAFFPAGLQLLARECAPAIPWGWGINGGFSVLASILAIIIAQFVGFKAVLLAANVFYLVALLAYYRWTNKQNIV